MQKLLLCIFLSLALAVEDFHLISEPKHPNLVADTDTSKPFWSDIYIPWINEPTYPAYPSFNNDPKTPSPKPVPAERTDYNMQRL